MAATPLPLDVDDLTADWFSDALGASVRAVTVLDRHSGTTGRVHVALDGDAPIPDTVFVKLAPFDAAQRKFVNQVGMGVTEARFYRDVAADVGLRVPRAYYAAHETRENEHRYVMVLEDLQAAGCRFPTTDDDDIEFRARDIVDELAGFHARFWESPRFESGGDLEWLARGGTGTGDGGATFVRMAVDAYAERLPDGFVPLAEFYIARSREVPPLYREGQRTLVHGDAHLGNLFVDGTRTGFLDWAVIAHAPGMRDVAYPLCNSIPTEVRRTHERALVAHYCELLAGHGIDLDVEVAWEQYRIFALYAWVAAAATLGMGSKWQPEHIGLGGTMRATHAAVDLDVLGLLEARLGSAT
jgi:hypothetical protein